MSAEDGKQLVSIGDGQYVELPEGYTLIQTEDGYIIGQPGATFVQVTTQVSYNLLIWCHISEVKQNDSALVFFNIQLKRIDLLL